MVVFRNIITLLAILVVTAGSTGMPQLIHYCADVPQSEACDPMACCDDAQESESDDCCSNELTFQNIGNEAAVTVATMIPAPAPCCDEATLLHGESVRQGLSPNAEGQFRLLPHLPGCCTPLASLPALGVFRI